MHIYLLSMIGGVFLAMSNTVYLLFKGKINGISTLTFDLWSFNGQILKSHLKGVVSYFQIMNF